MDKVKKLLAAGADLPMALRQALGVTFNEFCETNSLDRTWFSLVVNARAVPNEQILSSLSAQLGGSPEEWLALWFECARGVAEGASLEKVG